MGRLQIVHAMLAFALVACASSGDNQHGAGQARLLALAEVEADYAQCEVSDMGSIGGFHPYMPDCIADRTTASSARAWCDYPQATRLSAARLETTQATRCPGDVDIQPPQAHSIIARVIMYQLTPAHPDGLGDSETPLLRTSPLMWLLERCRADSYGGVSRETGLPVRDLSSGEALLCAALSESWARTRRAMYWPET